jgi:hypothetical protein
MSSQLSDADLLKHSEQIFAQLKAEGKPVEFLYACQDGNFFRDVHKNNATNFARESRQELMLIELVGSVPRIKGTAEPEDPMTRDVAALMLALNVTEDKARELITEHRGNTAAAVQAAGQEPAANAAPAKKKSSTKKNQADGTA